MDSLYDFETGDRDNLFDKFTRTGYDLLKKAGTALTLISPPTSAGGLAELGIKSKGLDTLEKLAFDNSFTYYGNWGGPNYSSNRNFKKGEQLTKDDVFQPSQDKLDELYKQHDLRYTLAMSKDDPKQRRNLLRDADLIFIRDAEKYLGSGKSTFKEKIYGYPSIKAFKAKLHFDLGYNVDQIPIDDSTENEIKKYIDFNDPTPKKPLEKINNFDVPKINLEINEPETEPETEPEPEPEPEIDPNNIIEIPYKYSPEFRAQIYSILFDEDDED